MVGSQGIRCVLAGMALLVGACGDEGRGMASNAELGVLGNAQFQWRSTGNGDLAGEPEFESTLPRHVALGARFDLDFELADRVPDELRKGSLVLASPVGVRASSFDYEATAPGLVTLMALTADGAVVDFARLEVRPVEQLQVVYDCDRLYETDDEGREVSMCGQSVEPIQPMGVSLSVRAEPHGGGDPLMGDLDYAWESRTPERVSVSDRGGHEADLELLRPGRAEIAVRTGSIEQVLSFEIEAGPVDASGPRRTRPGTDSDGDETDSSGTGGDTEGSSETDVDTDTDTEGASAGSSSTGGSQ